MHALELTTRGVQNDKVQAVFYRNQAFWAGRFGKFVNRFGTGKKIQYKPVKRYGYGSWFLVLGIYRTGPNIPVL